MNSKEKKYSGMISGNLFFIKVLNEIGLKNNYMGYYYLVEIINLLINEKVKASSFCKNIYPVVAEMFNKSACTVERDIRILISKCWNEKMRLILQCKYVKAKPSCCRFIVLIKNHILSLIN